MPTVVEMEPQLKMYLRWRYESEDVVVLLAPPLVETLATFHSSMLTISPKLAPLFEIVAQLQVKFSGVQMLRSTDRDH